MKHKDTKTRRHKEAAFLCAFVSWCLCVSTAAAQTPEALFDMRCESCHNVNNSVGAPLPQTLRQMSWQSILAALETGKMTGIGNRLSPVQREAIAKSIGTADPQPALINSKCSAPPQHRAGA